MSDYKDAPIEYKLGLGNEVERALKRDYWNTLDVRASRLQAKSTQVWVRHIYKGALVTIRSEF